MTWKALSHKCTLCNRTFISTKNNFRHMVKCRKRHQTGANKLRIFSKKFEMILGNARISPDKSFISPSIITDLTPIDLIPIGFARTPSAIRTRLTENQKQVLVEYYNLGESSGKRFTPEKVAILVNGHEKCQEECKIHPLEATQVKSFFSPQE